MESLQDRSGGKRCLGLNLGFLAAALNELFRILLPEKKERSKKTNEGLKEESEKEKKERRI